MDCVIWEWRVGCTDLPNSLSLLIELVAGGLIAFYVGRILKPKTEKVFEKNRKKAITIIFNRISLFDEYKKFIFDEMEREFGDLFRTRKEILPDTFKFVEESEVDNQITVNFVEKMKSDKKLQEMRNSLQPTVKQMKEIHKLFLDDFQFLSHYLDYDFLNDVMAYLGSVNYYMEWIFKNVLVYNALDRTKNLAEKIIEELNKNKDTNIPKVKEFIEKWKKELDQY